ncbi:MAG: hypothetical protein DRJ03_27690 [Chloroflexi bacterium]|nr:MAG: hypothetical protein DRJ03_27690 [Chloroflexota bacterium]
MRWNLLQETGKLLALLCLLAAGCAAPGARQGTSELQVAVEPVVEAVTDLKADIEATVDTVIAASADQSDRIVREVQAGQDLTIDQSTADKWLARLLAGGLVLVLVTYPVGKLIWLMGRRIRRR